MKNKKLLFISFLILAVYFFANTFSVTPIYRVPKLLSSMRAKEYCSCHFVLGFEKEYCLKRVRKKYPLFDYRVERGDVTFSNPFSSSTARFISTHIGCQLRK